MSDTRQFFVLSGLVHSQTPPREVGKNNTPVVEVRLDLEPGAKYPNVAPVEFWGREAVDAASPLVAGQRVEVECTVRGREWQGRYFVGIRAAKIVRAWPVEGLADAGGETSGETLPF
jgi:hypothetical protein